MSLDAVEADPSDSPDVVRACLQMTAAGIAVAVLPYALHVGAMLVLRALAGGGFRLADDDVTGMAQVMLLCTLAAGVIVLGSGMRAAWRTRLALRVHGYVGLWLALIAITLMLWCWPPFWYVTTVWMFVGATLATRPLWWAGASAGPMDADDVRTHRRYALAIAAGITVLSHVAAWTAVLASSFVVPPEEFARVEAIRRAEPVERREWELNAGSDGATTGGLDFIEMATDGGAVAAGRYVGGHWSFTQTALGLWPELAQAWIAPGPEGPTYAESWSIAALAFILSLAFWLPWMLWWTSIGAREARHTTAGSAPS